MGIIELKRSNLIWVGEKMKIDTKKLDMMLARRCMALANLRSGTSPQTLARIRRGEDVLPRTVGRISVALNCDPSDITVMPDGEVESEGGYYQREEKACTDQ